MVTGDIFSNQPETDYSAVDYMLMPSGRFMVARFSGMSYSGKRISPIRGTIRYPRYYRGEYLWKPYSFVFRSDVEAIFGRIIRKGHGSVCGWTRKYRQPTSIYFPKDDYAGGFSDLDLIARRQLGVRRAGDDHHHPEEESRT